MGYPVYQVLSSPRTGSGVLYHHAWRKSGNIAGRLGEYFNISDSKEETEQKFQFLENRKQENRHYCLKIHCGQIKDTNRTINYLKDYHVYVAQRNPWDAFLSYMFCELNEWKGPHRFPDNRFGRWTKQGKQFVEIETENFVLNITEDDIRQHTSIYKRDRDLIKDITSNIQHTIFDYDNLPNCNHTIPIGIDYEKHVPYKEKYKKLFLEYLHD
jgi:hypothetical protein